MDDFYFLNDSMWNESVWNESGVGGGGKLAPGDYDPASEWCDVGERESAVKTFQTLLFCLVLVLGVLGNGLVIAVFARRRRPSQRPRSLTDVFLFHLALADLLLLLTLPLRAADAHLGWRFSEPLCKMSRACYAVNTHSGLLLLAAISVDRYLAVARPQAVLRRRAQILRGGKAAAAAVWAAALLLSLPEILYSGVTRLGEQFHCGVVTSGRLKMATGGAIIAVFCLSFLVMVTCYSLIGRALWAGWRRRQRRGGKRCRQRRRTLKLMAALVLVFVLFQLPHAAVLLHKMAGGEWCGLRLVEDVTCTLAYVRCCLNPLLYALVGVRFRGDVMQLLRDAGCGLGHGGGGGAASLTPSSPALSALSLSSPSLSSAEAVAAAAAATPTKFHFPGNRRD